MENINQLSVAGNSALEILKNPKNLAIIGGLLFLTAIIVIENGYGIEANIDNSGNKSFKLSKNI